MKWKRYVMLLLTLAVGCKKPYSPHAVNNANQYLVVEGVINAGPDSTIIKLSRTVNLSSGSTINPDAGAIIAVESDANNSYPLQEIRSGYYTAVGLNLDVSKKFRLRIKTSNNQQYLSDFVAVNITPAIDSVGYTISGSGLSVYINTHDPQNNTRYYRWNFEETWQFHAQYESIYRTDGTKIVGRRPAQNIYNCFGNDKSSTVLIGSSAKLAKDVIYQAPITSVTPISEKIETKYSIQVQQYALTGDAYNFYANLKKNTEQLGSIFDAQPSSISGNIHNTANTSEPVIGYISACTVQKKRIFISNDQLPQAWKPVYPYDCLLDSNFYCRPLGSVCQNDVAIFLIPLGSPSIPTEGFGKGSGGFLGASKEYVDCTIRGTKKTPDFWK